MSSSNESELECRYATSTGKFYYEPYREWIDSLEAEFHNEDIRECFVEVPTVARRIRAGRAIEVTLLHSFSDPMQATLAAREVEERYGLLNPRNGDSWTVDGENLAVKKRFPVFGPEPEVLSQCVNEHTIKESVAVLATTIQLALWKLSEEYRAAEALLRVCSSSAKEVQDIVGSPWALARALSIPTKEIEDEVGPTVRIGFYAFAWMAPIDFERDRLEMLRTWRRSAALRCEMMRERWPNASRRLEIDEFVTEMDISRRGETGICRIIDRCKLLNRFDVSENPLAWIPDSIWGMAGLQHLIANGCSMLRIIPPLPMIERNVVAQSPIERIDVDRATIAGWEWAWLALPRLRYVSGLAGDPLEADFVTLMHGYLREAVSVHKHLDYLKLRTEYLKSAPRSVEFNAGDSLTMTAIALGRSYTPTELFNSLAEREDLGQSVLMNVGVFGWTTAKLRIHDSEIPDLSIELIDPWEDSLNAENIDIETVVCEYAVPTGLYPVFIGSVETESIKLIEHFICPSQSSDGSWSSLGWYGITTGIGTVVELCGYPVPWDYSDIEGYELSLAGVLVVGESQKNFVDVANLSFDLSYWESANLEQRNKLLDRLYNCGDTAEITDVDALASLSPVLIERAQVNAVSALTRARYRQTTLTFQSDYDESEDE